MVRYTRSHTVSDCPSICDSKFERWWCRISPECRYISPPLSLVIYGVVMGHYMNKLFPETSPPTILVTVWRSLPDSITMSGYRHCLSRCVFLYLLASILLRSRAFLLLFLLSLSLSPSFSFSPLNLSLSFSPSLSPAILSFLSISLVPSPSLFFLSFSFSLLLLWSHEFLFYVMHHNHLLYSFRCPNGPKFG